MGELTCSGFVLEQSPAATWETALATKGRSALFPSLLPHPSLGSGPFSYLGLLQHVLMVLSASGAAPLLRKCSLSGQGNVTCDQKSCPVGLGDWTPLDSPSAASLESAVRGMAHFAFGDPVTLLWLSPCQLEISM